MALSRFVLPFANVGKGIKPSSGAKLFFYATGTSTPASTFSDSAGSIPNTNPVIADSNGLFSDIFLSGTYKVILKDTNNVQIWEADPVNSVVEVPSTSVEFQQSGVGAIERTVSAKLNEFVSIKDFGAIGDGVTDDTVAVQAASASGLHIAVPNGTYLTTGTIPILTGQTWQMDNPVFVQNGVDFTTVFEADNVTDWAILGKVECRGSLATSADTGAEKGLSIKGGQRYIVENFISKTMRSHGIHIQDGLAASPRGDQGQFINCSSSACRTGVEIDTASAAEYNAFTDFNATGCLDGAIVGAGNTVFIGGNIVDNDRGVTLLSGYNHAHGGFTGTQISHNLVYNLKAVSVVNGHTFVGCKFYGDGGITGMIWLENCRGIGITGGTIGCVIYNDGATGQNSITNNYIPIATPNPTIFGTNPEYLRILDNWTDGGAWANNDGASEYSLITRAGTAQSITAGTTLVFNSAEKDKRSLYNISTGVYTTQTDGVYAIKTALVVTGAGFAAAGASYIQIEKNGVAVGFIPMVPVSNTVLVGSAATDLILAAGDTLELVSQIVGTSPVLGVTSNRLTIELDQ